MTLDDIADELYGVTPGEFISTRNARAKELAASGERALAAEVRKLAKPSVAAWSLNVLVRSNGASVSELVGLGAQIRQAQERGARDDMRRLATRRRELVDALLERALETAAAERTAGPGVRRDLQQSLEAAVADKASATALLTGRLSAPLLFVGFGDLPPTTEGAGGLPSGPNARTRARPPRRESASGPGKKAQRARADADRLLGRARAELESATTTVAEAQRADDSASAQVERSRAEVREAEAARTRSREALQHARQALGAARRQVVEAERARRACEADDGVTRTRGVAPG